MKRKAFRAALPYSLPICLGFLFMSISYGFMMRSRGFSVIYPIAMSALIFAGSMEFVTVELLLSQFDPLRAFFLTLMVNARHLFYGISMLGRYRGMGLKKFYLIFVTLLNQVYWVAGAAIGALLGLFIHFNTTGIEFVMTALFIVILTNQWEASKDNFPAIAGLAATFICLLIFGQDNFMIPAMISIVAVLTLARGREEQLYDNDNN